VILSLSPWSVSVAVLLSAVVSVTGGMMSASSKGKPVNSIVILLGGVHACSANHDIREFKIRVYNSIDMLPDSQKAVLGDDVPGVLDNTGLEEILCNLRDHICFGYHAEGADAILKEEDSP